MEFLRKVMNAGISREKILPYFSQLLAGVQAAHLQNVVHRDLKPENVLFNSQNNRLVVADFGIAHFEEEELYTAVETRDGTRLANFQYASPEQRSRGLSIDHRADIYALGLMLNEMFTGEIPQGTKYRTIASVAPEYGYFDELVNSMIRQSPAERPSPIRAINDELIARGNDFIESQKLNQLKQTVVPESEIDDPLILNPIELVDVDYDNHHHLVFKLSQDLNMDWVQALFKWETMKLSTASTLRTSRSQVIRHE